MGKSIINKNVFIKNRLLQRSHSIFFLLVTSESNRVSTTLWAFYNKYVLNMFWRSQTGAKFLVFKSQVISCVT